MSIDVTLHNELSSLYNECQKLIDELETDYARRLLSWDYINTKNNEKTNILELLKQITSQLEIHELILENSNSDTELDIEIDNACITITSSSLDFYSAIYSEELEDPELEQIQRIRSCMCIDILEDSGINVEINKNELILNYKDVKNE